MSTLIVDSRAADAIKEASSVWYKVLVSNRQGHCVHVKGGRKMNPLMNTILLICSTNNRFSLYCSALQPQVRQQPDIHKGVALI